MIIKRKCQLIISRKVYFRCPGPQPTRVGLGRIEAAELAHGWPVNSIGLFTVIERARAVMDLREIAAVARLQALVFCADDLVVDLGAVRTRMAWEVFYARSAVVGGGGLCATRRKWWTKGGVFTLLSSFFSTNGRWQTQNPACHPPLKIPAFALSLSPASRGKGKGQGQMNYGRCVVGNGENDIYWDGDFARNF